MKISTLESGQTYEREVVSSLEAEGAQVRDLFNKPSANFLDAVASQTDQKVFYYQSKLASPIGQIECEGIADLILIEKITADSFNVCVIDIKSSRRETTGYRLQVAFYARLHEVEIEPEEVPLSRAIEDFLFLEHHARRQAAYLFFALPPDVRAASGRCAVIRNEELREENKQLFAEFSFSDVHGSEPSVIEQKMLRFREGDWVVLNELRNENGKFPSAKSIVTGRLAVVEEGGANKIVLRLSSMCKASAFRYADRLFKPEAGRLYTIDQMLDDFNSDKFLAACRQAELTNPLYRWLTDAEEGKAPRLIRPMRQRAAQAVAALANRAQEPHELTDAQKEIIGNLLEEKAFVLQCPPGTGKSHTLGFAILARILALKVQGKPFRVAVSAKTHAAVKIALGSIAKRAKLLEEKLSDEPALAPLENLKVYKLCHETDEDLPDCVTAISPDGDEDASAAAQWDRLEGEDILIVVGTPGMLYNLIKRGTNRGKKDINWAAQYFDLVVVDEASQMGLAEALTAAAFLKSDGQFIAIGDQLFGFLKVKEVVDKLAPMVDGRLLIFFPGSYENNNYRLLDGYDGWNYLAVPITANKEL